MLRVDGVMSATAGVSCEVDAVSQPPDPAEQSEWQVAMLPEDSNSAYEQPVAHDDRWKALLPDLTRAEVGNVWTARHATS